jgi:Zn-dependent protease with chaperone function
VTSARSLYRLAVAFTAAAVAALLAATALALTTVAFHGPSLSAVIEACRDALSPSFSWPAVAVVLLASLSVLALTLAVRSVVRQARDVRRYLERVEVVEPLAVNDVVVLLVADERPQAFCAGWIRPRVYVSTGALIALDDDELQAVLAHEVHHQRRRDPLRLLMARAVSDAFFFLPALRRLSQRYAALAELAADDAAVAAVGDRSVLASALLSFGERREPDVVVGIAPERVDHLFGDPARWELPTWLMLGALFTLTGLLAMGAATAAAAQR